MKSKKIFDEDILKKLPLVYHLIQETTSSGGIPTAFVKSDFHQTDMYTARGFYKPISKIVNGKNPSVINE